MVDSERRARRTSILEQRDNEPMEEAASRQLPANQRRVSFSRQRRQRHFWGLLPPRYESTPSTEGNNTAAVGFIENTPPIMNLTPEDVTMEATAQLLAPYAPSSVTKPLPPCRCPKIAEASERTRRLSFGNGRIRGQIQRFGSLGSTSHARQFGPQQVLPSSGLDCGPLNAISDTFMLSANRNAHEPTYPESMILEATTCSTSSTPANDSSLSFAAEPSVIPPPDFDFSRTCDMHVLSKVPTPDTLLDLSHTGSTQALSKIPTPDTLLDLSQTMIVEPAAVRPATPAVAPIPEEEPYEPVVLDIDDAWLGIPLDPVRSSAKDCGEVKRLKDLTGHQILRELYTDIKSVGAELDREMKALKQSGEGMAKAVEDLDPKHDWFNMVAAANETHLEQLREKLAEVERANEEVRKKQALVSKLPELEKSEFEGF
ncbi:hypothetical protein L596_009975 [Steinernema carpocapsae]|uniref:Uncharacterized protein n=1 Tax=Steinernema carpocapsae TaxID=34508 RepID=A0A4U5PHE8_STECR|nr:hypothetical protein L596_009975 [Steinernema carpocapsae]